MIRYRKGRNRASRASIAFVIMLFAFTAYALLDTFVIARNYQAVETAAKETETIAAATEEESQSEAAGESQSEAAATLQSQTASSNGETDAASSNGETEVASSSAEQIDAASTEGVSIDLNEYRVEDTTIYVADITMSSAEYLKTAFADGVYGKNVKAKTSEIAAEADAVLAINGDFYGARERGYVIRNGVLYRNTGSGNEDLVIYEDGSWEIINENDITAEELLEKGAVQVFSFGPALVMDGEVSVEEGEEVGKAMASNPRTAIGIIDENHYVFVVSDGRTDESEGLSLSELAEFMKTLGVETAYNLDGGGSSTMVYNGEIINNPTTGGRNIKERSVSDIVYI